MRNRFAITIFIILIPALAAAWLLSGCSDSPLELSKVPQFSAVMVSEGDKTHVTYKVNVSGPNIRLEITSPGSGVIQIDKARGVIRTLMEHSKVFLELELKPKNKIPLLFAPDNILSYRQLGRETLDGRAVIKEKIVMQNKGDAEKEYYRWFDPDIAWPVKAEDIAGKWKMSLTDIVQGPQDPALFTPPPDYSMIGGAGSPAVPPASHSRP